jgi:hypothetical protein
LMYDKPGGIGPASRHLWEPFLHKSQFGVLRLGHLERHKFDRPTRTQRFRETGPPPTCPFI